MNTTTYGDYLSFVYNMLKQLYESIGRKPHCFTSLQRMYYTVTVGRSHSEDLLIETFLRAIVCWPLDGPQDIKPKCKCKCKVPICRMKFCRMNGETKKSKVVYQAHMHLIAPECCGNLSQLYCLAEACASAVSCPLQFCAEWRRLLLLQILLLLSPANRQRLPGGVGLRAATCKHHPPGHADYPLHDWSVTVAVRGRDVPTSWLQRMKAYAESKAECGCFATELGGRLKRLHIQGMLRLRSVTSEAYKDVLKKDIVAFVPIQRGSGGTVAVSPFGETQAWIPMLGYIQKDIRLGHYELAVHNISESDLRQVGLLCCFQRHRALSIMDGT